MFLFDNTNVGMTYVRYLLINYIIVLKFKYLSVFFCQYGILKELQPEDSLKALSK